MKIVASVLCLFVVVFPNSIESIRLFKKWVLAKNDQAPELAARYYLSYIRKGKIIELYPGSWKVGTQVENGREYVIGFIENGPDGQILCPFVNGDSKIKLRIDNYGLYADVLSPISGKDPVNDLLFKKYKRNTLVVQIKDKRIPLFEIID